jgi:predicted nucleic acid-binding protein
MKILIETNVLVAGVLEVHSAHTRVLPYLKRFQSGTENAFLCSHGLAEAYAILTSLPLSPKVSSAEAKRVLEATSSWLDVVTLGKSDYSAAIALVANLGFTSSSIYDALHAQAALKAKADVLLTLNKKHFLRLGQEVAKLVKEP